MKRTYLVIGRYRDRDGANELRIAAVAECERDARKDVRELHEASERSSSRWSELRIVRVKELLA